MTRKEIAVMKLAVRNSYSDHINCIKRTHDGKWHACSYMSNSEKYGWWLLAKSDADMRARFANI